MSHYEIYKAYRNMKKDYTKPFIPTRRKSTKFGTLLACGNITPRIGTILASTKLSTARVDEARIGECKIS